MNFNDTLSNDLSRSLIVNSDTTENSFVYDNKDQSILQENEGQSPTKCYRKENTLESPNQFNIKENEMSSPTKFNRKPNSLINPSKFNRNEKQFDLSDEPEVISMFPSTNPQLNKNEKDLISKFYFQFFESLKLIL